MNEYIKFPYWVPSWDDIKSINLEQFKNEAILESSKNIDLNLLRSFYKKDKDNFINLVDELSFRGFEFYNSKPSNLLKNIRYKEGFYLLSIEGKTENKIDFNKYLLGNFIKRFNINSPSFFNYIPLDGFKVFNPEINIEELKNDLLNSNFILIEFSEKNKGNMLDKSDKLQQKDNDEDNNVEKQKFNNIIEEDLEIEKIDVSIVFSDNAFKSALIFLKEKNIEFINDITIETINDFVYSKGIGTAKVERFITKLLEIYKRNKSSNNFKYDITKINFWFPEIEFNEFKEWCSLNSIYNVLDLNENIIKATLEDKRITNSIANKIQNKFELYKELINKEYDNNTLLINKDSDLDIETYFGESTYVTILNYLKSKGVNTIKDVNNSIISDFPYNKGTGINKVILFTNKLIEIFLSYYKTTKLNFDIYKVDFWFLLNDFEEFRELCKVMNIIYVEDITPETISKAKLIKGINKRKLEKIKDRLLEFNDLPKVEIEKEIEAAQIIEYWFKKIKDLKVQELQEVLESEFKINGDKFVRDINEDIINADYNKLIHYVNSIKSPREIFSEIQDIIKDPRNQQIIEQRYAEGYTLEQIGEKAGITRERVRQLIKKEVRNIINILKINNIKKSLILEFRGKTYCSLKEFYNLFSNGKEYLAIMILENYETLYFFKPLNMVLFSDCDEFEGNIEKLIGNLPQTFMLYDYLDILIDSLNELGIENPSIEEIENLLESYKYKIYGEYAFKGRLTIIEALEILFRDYINQDIRVDEEGCEYIKTIAKNKLNFDLGDSARAIESRIRDNNNIILTDRLTFRHISKLDISNDIIEKIKNILDNIFMEVDVVNVNYIFTENEELFKSKGIFNKLMLYSLISYYFSDYYKVGRGNTLDIYKNNEVKILSREDFLINVIKENGGLITKNNLIKITCWEDFKVENAISDSNKIVKVNDNIWLLEDFKISPEEEIILHNLINELINEDGFTTSYIIYKELMFNPKLSRLINLNCIRSHEVLGANIKKKFKNLKGYLTFITNENSSYKSIEEVITSKFCDIHYLDDIRQFLKNIGYKDMLVSKVLGSIIEKQLFVQISNDEVVNRRVFNINNEVIVELSKYIEEQFNYKEYLVLSELKGYRNALPQIEYKWNPYLIRSLLDGNEFRAINRIYSDSKLEKLIIVKEDSKIKTYAELIYMIISNEYEGNMNEVRIYDYLSDVGVVRKFDDIYSKKIPFDLKVSGKVQIDELGKVELLE